jgi:4-diphosphocytidyl-2-C-methyl-D-erythritol kinase
MIAFPNCKINLGLNIIRKRSDGFHDLETVFYPIAVKDALEIIPAQRPQNNNITFNSSGF